MEEEIGNLIGKGFGIWRSNLNLGIPFLLSIIFSALALIPLIVVAISVLGPTNIESLPSEQLLSMIMGSLTSLIAAFLLSILLVLLVGAFFDAGAIGMAKQALGTGKTKTDVMWSSGRKYFLRMFGMSVLIDLITIAGMVLLLPGILLLPQPLTLQNISPDSQAVGLLIAGLILLVVYAIAISIILSIAPYALVIDNLGPVNAIKTSIKFFSYNKFDVFIIWIVVIAISIGLQTIGSSVSVGTSTAAQPLSLITELVNLLVLSPLSAVWWARLYMDRTGKVLFREDLIGGIHESQ
jgi:hypothetical protein